MRSLALFLSVAALAAVQAAPKPEPDVLILSDGEKLIGHLVLSNGSSVRFASDILGEVTVDWAKVKELHSAQPFAVVTKDVKLGKKPDTSGVSEGPVNVADQKIVVSAPGGAKTIALADATHVLDVPTFEKASNGDPGFLHGWGGTVTAGASLVQATQSSRTFTESVSLVRGIPGEDWLPRRNRMTADFSSAYGLQSQPGSAHIKTSIYHGDFERDEYFSASAFGFGQAQFDHNYSQGLNLQQTYLGGIGWSALRRSNETLDLKGGVSYIRQQFSGATASNNLASSVFDERFTRKLGKGATFSQELSVSPSWSNTKAISALGNATLAVPVYKRFTFSTGVIENYLNNPPPGFRKNSFQFVTGLTYVLR